MALAIYRALLVLLPGWFREEFGGEMAADFRDTLTDARRHGTGATTALWMRTLRDLAALSRRLHIEAWQQDVAYAVRTLRRTPAFAVAVVATLAVGFGPTVVVANFLHQVVIAPLPFPEPGQLVRLWNARPSRSQSRVPLSVPDFRDYRARQTVFDAFAAHTGTSVAMVIGGVPRQIPGVLTSADLHQVLGVYPVLGRGLTDADTAPGALPVMVLGDSLWRTEFGARASVVGETILVDGQPTTIVGVLPAGFEFPPGTHNAWLPLQIDPADTTRGSHYLTATGRLTHGVSTDQASAALNVIAAALAVEYPDTNQGETIEAFGLKEQLNGDAPSLLAVLTVAIAAVLLVACLNVASLLTVRATVRGDELAVRTALGASGRRLRRQLLVEHGLLSLAGGALGAAIGIGLHRFIVTRRVLALPASAASMGWPAFLLLAGLVLAIGAAFAWIATRRSGARPLSETLLGTARQTSGAALLRARQAIVIAEVAAALVLLTIGALMMQSARRLAAVDPGFRTEQVLTFGVVLPPQDYGQAADRRRFVERVVEGLRTLPGVRDAAAGGYAPMGEMRATRRFAATDRPLPAAGAEPVALDMPVGPRYFEVMGIPLIDGRTFSDRDSADAAQVLVVSEEFARKTFPNEPAVGKQIRFYSSRPGGTPPPTREIVGVVRDVRQDGVAQLPMIQMYTPYAQNSWGFASFFLQAEGDPAPYGALVQKVVNSVDPRRPARDILTTGAIVRASTERQRALTWMLAGLAIAALLMAAIGLYGVTATAAAARSRELAIRAAVGAHPRLLLRLMLRQGLVTACLGVVAGAVATVAATGGLGVLLYETEPRDPMTFAATALLLLAIAGVATLIPARRAMTTNPAEVLRRG
jgi:putative ABC transport system permease protein